MGSPRHPSFLLQVRLNTCSVAKLHVINCGDGSPAFSWAPSTPEHPTCQLPDTPFFITAKQRETHLQTHWCAWGSEGFCWVWRGVGAQREHLGRNSWSRSSTRENQGGLIDSAVPWLGYASCAMFPEIGIHMSASMRAACPSSAWKLCKWKAFLHRLIWHVAFQELTIYSIHISSQRQHLYFYGLGGGGGEGGGKPSRKKKKKEIKKTTEQLITCVGGLVCNTPTTGL